LGLVELLGKFDLVMNGHFLRVMSRETHVHYCGKNIQNEIINIIGNSTRDNILGQVRKAKYYSIMLDCTLDINHIEQLSLTLRFFDIDEMCIKEHFIDFEPLFNSSDEGIYESISSMLNNFKLELSNCRGQRYDNGANMKGKNKGVQARILKTNPREFFMPCGCHSLNLVVRDSVSCTIESKNFFGTIQRVYILFSASVGR
jgi:hypothetical protein